MIGQSFSSRRRLLMKRAAWLLLLMCAWGCAPLTRPEGSGGGKAGVLQEGVEEPPSLLSQYLQQRRSNADSVGAMRPYIAVLSFVDKSGFRKDVWDLGPEMARLVSLEMGIFPDWRVVPFEVVQEVVAGTGKLKPEKAVELGRMMEADLVALGTIHDYNMGRFSVGDPLLGGYKSYTGTARLELQIVRVEDGSGVGTVEAARELTDRDVGLDLLGKPREQDLKFTGLKDTPFGSQAFRETVLGQATLEAVGELLQKLTGLVRPRALNMGGKVAEILSVYGNDVYINVGSENGLRAGYRFEVLPGAQRVREEGRDPVQRIGVVEVVEVIGARLSSVRFLEGGAAIRAGDRLEPIGAEDAEPGD